MHEGPFLSVKSRSEGFTKLLGYELGRLVSQGAVLALRGELGSGKTRFVQGLAHGLGVPPTERVSSPSFALIHEYLGGRLTLYHVDLYRLPHGIPDQELGLEEYLYGGGVCAIEWADRWPAWILGEHLDLAFVILGKRSRLINLKALGAHYQEVLWKLGERMRSLRK